MIKKNKSSLFTKIFIVTFLLTSLCCMITYGVISWLIPKTYSTTLDASLDSAVNSLLTEVKNLTPMESGNLIDEFIINQNGVLIQLFDSSNRAIELPSQNSTTFPVFVTGGVAIESDDPAAYRATHSYIFTFADSDDVYTLTVAGSAQEVNLLKDTLGGIFIILLLFCFRQYSFFIIFDRSRSNPYHRIFELLAQVLCFVAKLPVFMCSQKISN